MTGADFFELVAVGSTGETSPAPAFAIVDRMTEEIVGAPLPAPLRQLQTTRGTKDAALNGWTLKLQYDHGPRGMTLQYFMTTPFASSNVSDASQSGRTEKPVR